MNNGHKTLIGLALLGLMVGLTGCVTPVRDAAPGTTEYPDPKNDMRQPFLFVPHSGVLTNWLVCGEFPNPPHEGDKLYDHTPPCVGLDTDYLTEHGGETAIEPVEGMTHTRPDGTQAVWAKHSMAPHGVDFRMFPGIRNGQNRVAYAYTTLDWPEDGDAVLGLGSDDGIRVWVNGKLVHEHIVAREGTMDADIVPVRLQKGENRILVKVESAEGAWYFKMRAVSVAEMQGQATLNTQPRPEITQYPTAEDTALILNTDAAVYEKALHKETAVVEVLSPGGECIAKDETQRGKLVRFDTAEWKQGPYEVRIVWAGEAGRRTCKYLPVYVGEWKTRVVDILNACDRVDPASRTEKDLRLRLVKEYLIFLLKGDPRVNDCAGLKDNQWESIHFALMEYDETVMGPEAGPPAKVFHRLAWIEELDDSPQFCNVNLPREYDGKTRFPMIVDLHGKNSHKPTYVEWWRPRKRYGSIALEHPVIELAPHGRGNSGYRGLGERDVMKAIELAQEKFLVDPDRIYLTGHSMGGGGTWYLGARYPHLFAAIAPIYGGWDYRVSWDAETVAKMSTMSKFFAESWSSFSHAESLLSTPVFINHGDSDNSVNVEGSRYSARLLQRWGYDVRYREHPGCGHYPFPDEYVIIDWLLEHKLNRDPQEVRVRANRLTHASAHWINVEQQENPFAFIEVRARLVAPTTIALESSNALQITLSPGPKLVDYAKPMSVIWNGRYIGEQTFRGGTLVLRQQGYSPAAGEKKARVEGPLWDKNNLPFAIVCGTVSKDPGMNHVCKLRAETARDSWTEEWNAPPRYFLDTEVTDEIMSRYSLELYGGPEANLVTRKLMGKLPFALSGEDVTIDNKTFAAKDSAVAVICPNPMNADRYVTVFAGTSLRGMYFCNRVDQNFDFCVTDFRMLEKEGVERGDLGIVLGNFSHKWKYDPDYAMEGDPELRTESDFIRGPTIGTAKTDARQLFLSDLLEHRALGSFADMHRDRNWQDQPIRIGGTVYEKGMGVQADREQSLAEYDISGCGWTRLKSVIGIEYDPEMLRPGSKDKTSVFFVVRGDGRELYRSPLIDEVTPPQTIDIDVTGVKMLTLETGRKYQLGHLASSVNWGNLRLEK